MLAGTRQWRGAVPAVIVAAAVYFLAHLLIRSLAPEAVERDEAEQLLLTQWLQGGYSPQPPLYTWLQILVFQLTGPTVFGLGLLRTVLLFGVCALTYLIANRELRDTRLAELSTLSLLFIAQISWELQRENTHSLLVLVIAAAQFHSLQHLLRAPTAGGYAIAGALAGLGLLAKYNYPVYLAAIGLALLTTLRGRGLLFDRRVWIAAIALALVTLPHLAWLADRAATVLGQVSGKLDSEAQTALLQSISGLGRVIVSYLSPLWLLYLALFPRGYARLLQGRPAIATSFPFTAYFAIVLLILLALVMAFDADRFRERWLHPFLFLSPIFFLAHIDAELLTPRRERIFKGLAAGVATLVLAAMAVQMIGAPLTKSYSRVNAPFAALAEGIRATGKPVQQIVADHYLLAGTLRLHFPSASVFTLREDLFLPQPANVETLLVWDASKSKEIPVGLREYLAMQLPGKALSADLRPDYVEVPYAGAPAGVYRLGLLTFP